MPHSVPTIATALGKRAYTAYSQSTRGRTHDGRPMPDWDGLGEPIQKAWTAAALAVADVLNKRPEA